VIPWLDAGDPEFPPLDSALRNPNGLLAAGGDLSPPRLLSAYRQGIFPWYEDPQPILWWSPDPHAVLFPERLHIPGSLRKPLKHAKYRVSADDAFERVIRACAAPRNYSEETWIGRDMQRAYCELHRLGHAHSVEVWDNETLVGGLYGIAIGRIFFGESMFHSVPDASKIALVHLTGQLRAWGFAVIDCQQDTAHMRRMGAETIPRAQFRAILDRNTSLPGPLAPWRFDWTYGDDEWATR
jgi:leucyl/phenylalanyl-tRNA--protein transferase